jgi:hypothetical protein
MTSSPSRHGDCLTKRCNYYACGAGNVTSIPNLVQVPISVLITTVVRSIRNPPILLHYTRGKLC